MVEGRTRDLATFNLAINSKLRGCDIMALKVEDVAPHGYTTHRAIVRQKKTGRPVKLELTEQTRLSTIISQQQARNRANFCSPAVRSAGP
jgi:hypothetical protein